MKKQLRAILTACEDDPSDYSPFVPITELDDLYNNEGDQVKIPELITLRMQFLSDGEECDKWTAFEKPKIHKSVLLEFCDNDRGFVPVAQWAFRSTPREAKGGRTPFEIVCGMVPQGPLDKLFERIDNAVQQLECRAVAGHFRIGLLDTFSEPI